MSNFILKNEPFGSYGISTEYPEKLLTGPFAPIYSAALGVININANSNIFLGMNLNNKLNISNKNLTIPIASDSTWRVWLEVFFADGAPFAANFNYSNEWWQNYPDMQEYNNSIKILTNQTALRIPVATIDPLNLSSDDIDGFIIESNNYLLKVRRHIFNDLILFQSCDGFMFLPSPFSLVASLDETSPPEEE